MKKILIFILVFMFCISINPLFSKDRKYPENVCKEIFDAIGIFLTLTIKNGNKQEMMKGMNWKNKNMQKRHFSSLMQQQIIQLYMKLFVDKIIV